MPQKVHQDTFWWRTCTSKSFSFVGVLSDTLQRRSEIFLQSWRYILFLCLFEFLHAFYFWVFWLWRPPPKWPIVCRVHGALNSAHFTSFLSILFVVLFLGFAIGLYRWRSVKMCIHSLLFNQRLLSALMLLEKVTFPGNTCRKYNSSVLGQKTWITIKRIHVFLEWSRYV